MNKHDLEKVKKMDELINAKIAERDQLKELATSISSKPIDGMPYSNSGMVSDPVGNSVVKLNIMANQIDKLIDEFVEYKQKIINALENLPEKEYGVLHRHYIRYMSWDSIADDMHYSRQQVWRYWKKGLKILKDVT